MDSVQAPVVVADPVEAAVMVAIVTERAGVLAHARAMCGSIARLEAQGLLGHADASFVRRVLRNFSNDIAIGFHVEGDPSPQLLAQMRLTMEAHRG